MSSGVYDQAAAATAIAHADKEAKVGGRKANSRNFVPEEVDLAEVKALNARLVAFLDARLPTAAGVADAQAAEGRRGTSPEPGGNQYKRRSFCNVFLITKQRSTGNSSYITPAIWAW